MIDVHSHIVFDVDDGPKTLEESLDLIGESFAQGVRTIVSTSHRRKGMFETPEDKIFANFKKVKEEAEALYPDLTIFYGGELYYTSDIVEKLEKKLIPRMHNFGDKDKVRKKRVRFFLEKNLVHMVASDMHNLGPRPPFMKDAYEIVKKNYGPKRAKNLFIENPKTLLENQYL